MTAAIGGGASPVSLSFFHSLFFILFFSEKQSRALLLCCVSPSQSQPVPAGRTGKLGRPTTSTRLTMCSDTRHNRIDMYSQLVFEVSNQGTIVGMRSEEVRFSVPAV